MLLTNIRLHQFRNIEDTKYSIGTYLTMVVGENARGKTNILESILFLLNGTGFRESREDELIMFEKNQGYVEGVFTDSSDTLHFKVYLEKQAVSTLKIFFLQKARKRQYKYLSEQTRAVLFSPEQIEIIIGSPEKRRSYFNLVISLFYPEYKKKLVNYESAVRKRNKVLELVRDEGRLQSELTFWNNYLIEQGSFITKKREEYIAYLNSNPKLDSKEFKIVYQKNEVTKERFVEKYEFEKRIRKTAIGPQKDDFIIFLKNGFDRNIHHFGSRSEQRLGVFWLKMNEIHYIKEHFDKKPILLLDDVFSEFDMHNKKLILDLITTYQTILTTTEEEIIELIDIKKEIIRL